MNETQYQLVKVIHKLRLFKGLELPDIQKLLPICRYMKYGTGDRIYGRGQPSTEMLILLTGKLSVVGDAGEVLAEIPPGSPVGELGVFTGEPRSANISAAEPAAGFALSKTDLQKVFSTNKGIYFKIQSNVVAVLSERLRQANGLNDEHLQKIMDLEDLLVKHTGKTARELGVD